MPATISCDTPVVIHASNSEAGVRAERRWIGKYYPGHSDYGQALVGGDGRMYDVLNFKDRDGRAISVCFDITGWFGKF